MFFCGLAAVVGCNSTPEEPDNTGGPIPKTEAPTFDVPQEMSAYAPVFQRGKCMVHCVAMASPKSVRHEEWEGFANNFNEHFFTTCFKNVDVNSVNASIEKLNTETGAINALAEEAASAKADYHVKISYVLDVQPYSDPGGRRDLSAKIIAKGICKLKATGVKGGKEDTFTFKLDQITSHAKEIEFRDAHAQVIGRCLAQQALVKISQARGARAESMITLVFRGFDNSDKVVLRESLSGMKEIDGDSIEERSSGSQRVEFRFVVTARVSIGTLKDELQAIMEDEWSQVESRQPNQTTLTFYKR